MKKLISCLISSAMILSFGVVGNAENNKINVERISGGSRYSTPVEISKKYFKSSDTVVLASGEGFADALVGGSLTAQRKIPMFLTSKNSIFKEVKDEIVRLKVKKVYILGGNGSVSKNVENQVKSLGTSIVRLGGRNRFETASKIAEERFRLNSKNNREITGDIYVGINGYNYADALVAGSFVGQLKDFSIILPYQSSFIGENNPGYEIVFGGFKSIPNLPDIGIRIAGQNRFQTSVEAAKKFEMMTGKKLKTIVLVDGTNYPDALAASTVAGKENAAVITTPSNTLNKDVKKFIRNNGIDRVIIIGGEKSVSKDIEYEINDTEDLSSQKLGGWKIIGEDKFYYENGNKVIGWKSIDGNKYYFDNEGKIKTGWLTEKRLVGSQERNVRYYFNNDGSLSREGSENNGWVTLENGISVIKEEVKNNKVNEFIEKKMPQIANAISSKEIVLFKESKSVDGYDYFNLSKASDYWYTNINGVVHEGSNNILNRLRIDIYSGVVELVSKN